MKFNILSRVVLFWCLLAMGMVLVGVQAEHHNAVKHLRDTGGILPLEDIIAQYRRHHRDGRILEAELEYEEGRYVYELKILHDDGVVQEFEYDARTGEFWRIEEKH